MQWSVPSSQIGHRPAGTTEFASGSIGNRPTWTHHVNCLIEGPFGEGNTAALLLKRPDGRCRRLGLSRNAELSFGTIENGSAASDLPPEGPKKKSWADLTHLAHFAKSKPRDYRKWIRSVRFTPRGFEKKELGRFDASGAFRGFGGFGQDFGSEM